MDKTQVFHIGFHKTGTTWFQKEFYSKVSNYQVVDRASLQNEFLKTAHIKRDLSQNLLFCDEELSGNIHTGGNGGLTGFSVADRISESYPNAKVIIFIRNQFSMISSSYLQYIKKGGNYSIKKYISHQDFPDTHRAPLFSFNHFDYLELISYYENKVGKKNVFVYLFEEFKSDQEFFLEKFTANHGFKIELGKLNLEKKNTSYRSGNLFLSRILNSFTRKDVLYKYYIFHIPRFHNLVSTILSRVSIGSKIKPKTILGKSIVSEINVRYKESNTILAEKYNLDLTKYEYPLND